MAKKQTVRIRPSTLRGDLHAYTALKSLADYIPANPAYTQQAAVSIMEAMKNATQRPKRAGSRPRRRSSRRMGIPQLHALSQRPGHRPLWQQLQPGASPGLEEKVRAQDPWSQGERRNKGNHPKSLITLLITFHFFTSTSQKI